MEKNRGFTLIELVVTMAIVLVLFTFLASVIPIVWNTSDTGSDLSQAQNLAQMKMQAMESKLKYAISMDVCSSLPASPAEDFQYLYLASDGNLYTSLYGVTTPISSDEGFQSYRYIVTFTPVNKQVLRVNLIVKKSGSQVYQTSTQIFLTNLMSGSITGVATGTCVCFKWIQVPVTGITVSSPSAYISVNEQTLQMNASVYPANATNKGIAWSVDNTACASINQNGLLTPLDNGTVTVTALSLDGSQVYGTKQIVISNQHTTITSLTLTTSTGDELVLAYGHTITILPHIAPLNAANQSLTWKVDNTAYAQIDQNGVLTTGYVKNTSVIITASTNDGSNITATIEIRIVG